MPKHPKKPSPAQSAKQLTAQNRKLFFERFKNLLYLLTGSHDLYKAIPAEMLEFIYDHRVLAVKVEAASGSIIDKHDLKMMKETFRYAIRNQTIAVGDNGGSISLSEFSTIGMTLIGCDAFIKKDAYEDADKLIALSSLFNKKQELPGSGWPSLAYKLHAACIIESSLTESMYWGSISPEITWSNNMPCLCTTIKLNKHIQEKIAICIEGNTRPAVRVTTINYAEIGLNLCEREAALFGLPESHGMLPVYIQMHALNRITERLDCANTILLNFLIYLSAKTGKVHKGSNGNYLIEFMYIDWKAGYFTAVVHENKLVIRTFLFLTNNGTPEGKKLTELAGLQKQDKHYLSLDKLSTFLNEDFRRNEAMRRLFFDAGCGDLFELAKKHTIGDGVDRDVNVKSMMDYLKLNPVDADALPDFSDALAHSRYS